MALAPPSRASAPAGPACAGQPWLRVQPDPDEDWVYGAGTGPSPAVAERDARERVAASISIEVHSETRDQQMERQSRQGNGTVAQQSAQSYEEDRSTLVRRRLELCRVQDACADREGSHALVRCARQSALDRELRKAARALAAALPKNARVVVIPATGEDGYVTGLGEYAASVVESTMSKSLPAGAKLCDPPLWEEPSIQEVARKHKISCSVQLEYLPAPGGRTHFRTRIVDLASEQSLDGSQNDFDVELDVGDGELLQSRRALFKNKQAWDLAANKSSQHADLHLKKANLNEGDDVQFEFTLSHDRFVYLFDIYEDGRAAMLLPNPEIPNNKFTAGRYTLPDKAWREKGLSITACPMPGSTETRETVKLVTSPTPLDLDAARFTTADMVNLEAGPNGNLGVLTRQLDDLRREGAPLAEATAPYIVRATPGRESRCPK